MKKITIISSVVDGKVKRNRNLLIDALKGFEGKNIEVTVQRLRKRRSNPQNRFYWGVVLPLIQGGLKDATGEIRDFNSIHYQILLPLLAPSRDIINTDTGMVISERLTSSEMTTTEFMDYLMEIQKWAADFLNIQIPDPNEETELQFN